MMIRIVHRGDARLVRTCPQIHLQRVGASRTVAESAGILGCSCWHYWVTCSRLQEFVAEDRQVHALSWRELGIGLLAYVQKQDGQIRLYDDHHRVH